VQNAHSVSKPRLHTRFNRALALFCLLLLNWAFAALFSSGGFVKIEGGGGIFASSVGIIAIVAPIFKFLTVLLTSSSSAVAPAASGPGVEKDKAAERADNEKRLAITYNVKGGGMLDLSEFTQM
jgi:hypothetical protein